MNFYTISRLIAVIALAVTAGAAAASNEVLTGKTGMTIYTFDRDAPGKNNCSGSCIALWPAVPAADAPFTHGDFGSITRTDGVEQLTYKDRPVYYYVQDKRPGDVTGDNVGGVWHAVRKNNARTAPAKSRASYGDGYSLSY